jgi:NADH-quinone oxidoreductase subunit G
MKYEARRDGMMRKGISDVDTVLTARELTRLIKLYGIDITNVEYEPADDPMAMRSSAAVLAEASGGLAEGVIRSLYYMNFKKEIDRHLFKRLRSAGSFREISVPLGDLELNIAVIDGLNGLEKLKSSQEAGRIYDLIEVMTCPGGCVHGAGLPFCTSRDELKNRIKQVYLAEETEAINLPGKSPVLITFYEKFLKEHAEIADRKILYTHYSARDVLL